MRVIDPGHRYALAPLDGDLDQVLTFVKREGPKYPGNVGHRPGTTMQEVLRAVADRLRYVNAQTPCSETESCVGLVDAAILLLEVRAARTHGRHLTAPLAAVVAGTGACPRCGHVGCDGSVHVAPAGVH